MHTRRKVITAGTGLVIAGLAVAGANQVYCDYGVATALRLDRLDLALADIRGATRIGHAWRAAHDPDAIAAEVLDRDDLIAAMALECPATRRERLRAVVRADFAAGRMAVADRFIVARAEGVVAALRA